ncbi:hypothetical protein MVA47_09090 [Williamsia sp. DF01-3]|nr:hypothetical protein [Williamsia sp. DF01-3]
MKSDFQISTGSVYNTFPFLSLDTAQRALITEMATAVVDARAQFPGMSLAQMYDRDGMPPKLRERHLQLDAELLRMYNLDPSINDYDLSTALFERYAAAVMANSETTSS